MDKRHIYGIMLDTETANTIVVDNDKPIMDYVLPYDIGFAVIDSHGRVYETYSFVNEDIFCDEYTLMQSAYYSEKIPNYIRDLAHQKRKLKNTYEIRKFLLDKIKEYDCKFLAAHNARFDYKALNNIQRWTTKSKYRYFLPKDLEIWDTLKMCRSVLKNKPTYIDFCKENGYMTKHRTPQPQFTAEVVYRYITQDTDFKESHTGLEDVLIEAEILKYCVNQHKPMKKLLFEKK